MNCKFCNKKCKKYPIYYLCKSCNTEFRFSGVINIYCTINDKKYFYQDRSVFRYKEPARIMRDGIGQQEAVIEFKELPNITPQNIKEKLKTYIMFS